ncbi:hypothetical protein [Sphingomonas koreensis]
MRTKFVTISTLGGLFLAAQANATQDAPPVAPAPPAPPPPPVVVPAPLVVIPPAPPRAAVEKDKLRGNFVYIYSFLDVREDGYTTKVIDQFDADLIARLGTVSASGKILRFKQSKLNRTEEFFAGGSLDGSESRAIPVMQTIASNLQNEIAANARYRLIIFPSNYIVSGAWRHYEIRFVLMDTITNSRVMNYDYSGRHMVLFSSSENAAARSKKIIDALFAQLTAEGLL